MNQKLMGFMLLYYNTYFTMKLQNFREHIFLWYMWQTYSHQLHFSQRLYKKIIPIARLSNYFPWKNYQIMLESKVDKGTMADQILPCPSHHNHFIPWLFLALEHRMGGGDSMWSSKESCYKIICTFPPSPQVRDALVSYAELIGPQHWFSSAISTDNFSFTISITQERRQLTPAIISTQ